ncbi:hypothetical protein VVR84_05310 [Kocuria carniphila]|uniref:N-acetyltransferase domain-containing protein n=1 Tax=Kocuria carniphila TaxID=262208 RepID=A0ABV3V193_9MICC
MGRWWGRGYAKAAASSAVELLREDDVAHIFPGHVSSERVAQKLSLHSTAQLVDGEAVWATDDPNDA